MSIPSRTQLREWLAYLSMDQIKLKLDHIKIEHGAMVDADLRHFLNCDKAGFNKGILLIPDGEIALMQDKKNDHIRSLTRQAS